MNIKQGYKQTEIGIIPEDWEVEKFFDVTDLITCGLAATPTYVSEQNGKPFLSAQNVNSGKVILNKYKFISNDLFYQITKHNSPEKGDLLYTRVGAGIGEAGVIETDLKFGIYVSLTLIKTNKKLLDNYFLLHILNSPNYKFLAKNGQLAGGGVQNLNVQTVKEFPIILPPLKEQTAIATALSDIDALIGELDKLIAKKQGIKQATMQQLLTGKKRLAGFSGEWEVKRFKEVTHLITCGIAATPKYVYENEGVPFLSSTNVKNGQIGWNNFKFISNELHTQLYKNNPPLRGDILYSRVGTIGEAAIIDVDFEFSIYVSLTLIKTNKLNNEFLKQMLNSNKYKKLANNTVLMGGGVGNLNVNVVRDFPISFPSIKEQTAIAKILSDMDAEISQLEGRRAKMGELKQGMMQELLTGRIRLTGGRYL
jgi:type I restriction enzyme S subunit